MPTLEQPPQEGILFFDDFTAPQLDRSTWNVEVTGPVYNDEQQAYVDSPGTVCLEPGAPGDARGVLALRPRYAPGTLTTQGRPFDFISGRVHTRGKLEFVSPSSISARIRLPIGAGLWPAFWVLGASGPWPQCGEIDIMESVGEPDWTSAALHGPGYSGETPLVNKKYFLNGQDPAAWRVYALEWTPADELLFKIDGELVYRVTRSMVEYYGPWVFGGSKFLILNFALGGTYPHKTNGVRDPYYGIPQETVERIRRGEVEMLVDWVKVTGSGGRQGFEVVK